MRVQSASLKNHIFSVFFTQATRYSLVILLIDTSSLSSSPSFSSYCSSSFDSLHLDARGARTKIPSTLSPSFPLFSLLENRRYHRIPYPFPSEISSFAFHTFFPFSRLEEKYTRYSLTKSHEHLTKCVVPFLPPILFRTLLFFASLFVLVLPTYVYLVAENIRECR